MQNQPTLDAIEEKDHLDNTLIRKIIQGRSYLGQVSQYNPKIDLYWIDYENGEYEELDYDSVAAYKCSDRGHDRLPRFTRSSLNKAKEKAAYVAKQVEGLLEAAMPYNKANSKSFGDQVSKEFQITSPRDILPRITK